MIKLILSCLILITAVSAFADELIFNTQEFKPFSYQDSGNNLGVGVEIVQSVCKKAGLDCKLNFYPWTRAQKGVEEGQADGLFILAKTPEREKWLTFTESLIESEYALFVPKDDTKNYSSAKEFTGKKIGVYGPSGTSASLEKMAAEVEGITIDQSVDDIAAFKKLNIKRVDAAYSNKDVGLMLIKDLTLDQVKYAFGHKKIVYYIAFNKNSAKQPAIDKFLKGVADFKKSGELKKLLDKYHMTEAK